MAIWLWLLWRIVLWKEILCKTWIAFILMKCICFIIKINHVWSRVKNIAKKPIVFQKKRIVFKHVHFFIPLFWNEKLSLLVLLVLQCLCLVHSVHLPRVSPPSPVRTAYFFILPYLGFVYCIPLNNKNNTGRGCCLNLFSFV